MWLGFGTALLLLGRKSQIFYFLPAMKHTQKQHKYNDQLQRWGELLSQSCPSSAKQGGLTSAANICREPTGLIAGLAWIWPEYSPVPGIPSWHCLEFVGQKSTKLPFSAKDPAHQGIYVHLFKGISLKGQDHSYSQFEEKSQKQPVCRWVTQENTRTHDLYIVILPSDE